MPPPVRVIGASPATDAPAALLLEEQGKAPGVAMPLKISVEPIAVLARNQPSTAGMLDADRQVLEGLIGEDRREPLGNLDSTRQLTDRTGRAGINAGG
jgi:hypothetical protein